MSEPLVLSPVGHPRIAVATTSGKITVTAEPRDDIVVEGGVRAPEPTAVGSDGRIDIPTRHSKPVEIRCPEDTDVIAGTVSASVELVGQLGDARVTTVSGSITVEEVVSIDVRSVSGRVEVERCHGRCRVRTKSGTVRIDHAGPTEIGIVSGSVEVGQADGELRVRAVSSSLDLGASGAGDVDVHTISGKVTVRLPVGVRPSTRLRSVSGKPRSELDEGDDCRVSVKTASGRIAVVQD
jgi:DUF4097 and DUF4098 domain-containing protein YvlB